MWAMSNYLKVLDRAPIVLQTAGERHFLVPHLLFRATVEAEAAEGGGDAVATSDAADIWPAAALVIGEKGM